MHRRLVTRSAVSRTRLVADVGTNIVRVAEAAPLEPKSPQLALVARQGDQIRAAAPSDRPKKGAEEMRPPNKAPSDPRLTLLIYRARSRHVSAKLPATPRFRPSATSVATAHDKPEALSQEREGPLTCTFICSGGRI
jgi:hypothetical protein